MGGLTVEQLQKILKLFERPYPDYEVCFKWYGSFEPTEAVITHSNKAIIITDDADELLDEDKDCLHGMMLGSNWIVYGL